jgi:hypothetical protein
VPTAGRVCRRSRWSPGAAADDFSNCRAPPTRAGEVSLIVQACRAAPASHLLSVVGLAKLKSSSSTATEQETRGACYRRTRQRPVTDAHRAATWDVVHVMRWSLSASPPAASIAEGSTSGRAERVSSCSQPAGNPGRSRGRSTEPDETFEYGGRIPAVIATVVVRSLRSASRSLGVCGVGR